MSIRRRWIATCDAPDCSEHEVLEGDQFDGKWTLGESISDHGWQASPGAHETYCPKHFTQPRAARDADLVSYDQLSREVVELRAEVERLNRDNEQWHISARDQFDRAERADAIAAEAQERLAKVEALADEWEREWEELVASGGVGNGHAARHGAGRRIRAALASSTSPAEQEGER